MCEQVSLNYCHYLVTESVICSFLALVLWAVTDIAHWCYDHATHFGCYIFRLQGNPLCSNTNLVHFCGSSTGDENNLQSSTNTTSCPSDACPPQYEYSPTSPEPCVCYAPLLVGYRLKSPGFRDFRPYKDTLEKFLTSTLELFLYQLYIESYAWEKGPRLGMYLKLFPVYDVNINNTHVFNGSEVQRIMRRFISWKIYDPDVFGPYEVLNFTLLDVYKDGLSLNTSPIYYAR